jgi:hypothetical protein
VSQTPTAPQQYTERELLEARAIEWENAFHSQTARSVSLLIEINRLSAENATLRQEVERLKTTPVTS